jgi:hypothetical protein
MPSLSRLQRKRDALQGEYDLLSEKIRNLRTAHAIETGTAIRFQLEKQIEQAESERDAIERKIESLERELERRKSDEPDLTRSPRQHIPTRLIYALFIAGILVTLLELLGLALKGFRFLGAFAPNSGVVLTAVVALTALIDLSCGYVLLKRRVGAGSWRKRPQAYGTRNHNGHAGPDHWCAPIRYRSRTASSPWSTGCGSCPVR